MRHAMATPAATFLPVHLGVQRVGFHRVRARLSREGSAETSSTGASGVHGRDLRLARLGIIVQGLAASMESAA
jgi:hypothetical protein